MTRTAFAAAATALLLGSATASAQELTAERASAAARQAVEDFDVTGLSVAVVKGDEIVFMNSYGVRDVRQPDVPVTTDTIFPFASVSKAFTTTAIAMLVDDGVMDWDDPVRDFIPEFEMSDPYITAEFSVRDLVTHRSGLPLGAAQNVPSAFSAMAGQAAYSGSKQALTRWMRRNNAGYAAQGVRLNAIGPGYTRTAMSAAVEQDPVYGPAIKEFVATIPLQRPGQPEDMAQAVSFLLGDAASFISGSMLFVDGGHDALFRPDSF